MHVSGESVSNETDGPEQLEKEEPYNAADAASVNKQRKKSARHKYDRLEVVKALLQNRPTRQWLWEILEFCAVYNQTFVQGQPDSSAFAEGRRSVGNRLLADLIEADEEGYLRMLKEGKTYHQ